MGVNGTPQPGGKIPRKKLSEPVSNGGGKKGGSGCMPALVTIALLGSGWLHMVATSAWWTS